MRSSVLACFEHMRCCSARLRPAGPHWPHWSPPGHAPDRLSSRSGHSLRPVRGGIAPPSAAGITGAGPAQARRIARHLPMRASPSQLQSWLRPYGAQACLLPTQRPAAPPPCLQVAAQAGRASPARLGGGLGRSSRLLKRPCAAGGSPGCDASPRLAGRYSCKRACPPAAQRPRRAGCRLGAASQTAQAPPPRLGRGPGRSGRLIQARTVPLHAGGECMPTRLLPTRL